MPELPQHSWGSGFFFFLACKFQRLVDTVKANIPMKFDNFYRSQYWFLTQKILSCTLKGRNETEIRETRPMNLKKTERGLRFERLDFVRTNLKTQYALDLLLQEEPLQRRKNNLIFFIKKKFWVFIFIFDKPKLGS